MRIVRFFLLIAVALCTGVAAALVWLWPVPRRRERAIRRIAKASAGVMLWILGVRVEAWPWPEHSAGAALYAVNHTGYLDILVVMAVCPGVFISRRGVMWWPLLGQLIALGGTLFVDRRKRFSIGRMVEKVRRRLSTGASIVFFPEATSSDGRGLLPFKSALFAAAADAGGQGFPVRPLVLCYRSFAGGPIDDTNRHRVYWYGNMALLGHLWGMLAAPGVDVVVKALPERRIDGDRRAFSKELREEMLREFLALRAQADAVA